ncbi:hypothetical protein EB796_008961 [Bugula neritina]|uniref:Uncharacterized protein n=1 Tax=Bugula neritina TaxID=10212 RepID=A0A7J7IYQ2_BUGNE|nr:hypothetical protein EB796_022988 [Bugula neritina]KAF6032743.1 hypothetical protein EB796_008961 [Bugula neritina]
MQKKVTDQGGYPYPENIYQTARHTSRLHQPPDTKHMGTQSMHLSLNTCCTSASPLQDSDDPVVMGMLTAI